MAALTALTHETFSDFVTANRLAVVHFWAVWNGHDVQMRKTLESLADEWSGVAFGAFECDPPAHWDICRAHQITSLPFVAFYRDRLLAFSFRSSNATAVLSQYLSDLVHGGN